MGNSGLAFALVDEALSNTSISLLLLTSLHVVFRYNQLRKKFPATSFTGSPVLSDAGFDLLNRLLTYDPEKVFLRQIDAILLLCDSGLT